MRSNASPLLRVAAYGGLAFLHLPILLIFLYAFTTEERTYAFPPPGLMPAQRDVARLDNLQSHAK